MSDIQHTPGPWFIEDQDGGTPMIVAIGPHRHIELASVYFTDFPDGAANARMIAAAPDLLAACKAALDDVCIDSDVIKQLGAAVAKAEGVEARQP